MQKWRGYSVAVSFHSTSCRCRSASLTACAGLRIVAIWWLEVQLGEKNFFFTEQALGHNAIIAAVFDQLVRLNDGIRLLGVFQTHHVVQPRLLAHGVNVQFPATELLHDAIGALEVRP